jgi:ketosteroid isomerase-like protein
MTQTVTFTPESIKRTLDTYFGGLSRLDMRACASAFAPDGVCEDPKGSEPQHGRAAIAAYFEGLAASLKSFDIAPTTVYTSGGGAAVAWAASWTGRNGRSGKFTGVDVLGIDGNGQISSLVAYWDTAVLAEMNA